MARFFYKQGVKPVSLTTPSEVRTLLCYLMHNVPQPLSLDELMETLQGEELVNYFEMMEALDLLCENGLARKENDRYVLLPPGVDVARNIGDSLPFTVRECAVRGAVRIQRFAQKSAEHKTSVTPAVGGGFNVRCTIEENGCEMFGCALFAPDEASANYMRTRFVEHADILYALMLAGATGSRDLTETALKMARERRADEDTEEDAFFTGGSGNKPSAAKE